METGFSPSSWARVMTMGHMAAAVAVWDMILPRMMQMMATAPYSTQGEMFSPAMPMMVLAMSRPAPLFSTPTANPREPPSTMTVTQSMPWITSLKEMHPVRIHSSAPTMATVPTVQIWVIKPMTARMIMTMEMIFLGVIPWPPVVSIGVSLCTLSSKSRCFFIRW